MVTLRETEEGSLFVEAQGPFAPERLPDTDEPTVFSRQFTDGTYVYDVTASPVVPDRYKEWFTGYEGEMPEDGYEVEVIFETREVGDEGGDTSEYEYETIAFGLTLSDAMEAAREYVEEYL